MNTWKNFIFLGCLNWLGILILAHYLLLLDTTLLVLGQYPIRSSVSRRPSVGLWLERTHVPRIPQEGALPTAQRETNQDSQPKANKIFILFCLVSSAFFFSLPICYLSSISFFFLHIICYIWEININHIPADWVLMKAVVYSNCLPSTYFKLSLWD